ncbi:MAG: signal peptide peptidase SppA [Rikenellaceae bacterium]|jgi:protease-4|nr:signal peptide peptidase SppA [Rikenellaceae bacterium]
MNFFKTFLATLLAMVAGTFLFTVVSLMFMIAVSTMVGGNRSIEVGRNSLLKIDLGANYMDSPAPATIEPFGLSGLRVNKRTSLLSLLSAVEAAANDERIEGILLCGGDMPSLDVAQGEELRKALLAFRESGKPVISYADSYSQLGYYICSVADDVAMNPKGLMAWHGMSMQLLFFKGLLDKLDVEPTVIRHGHFKSAVEPFMLERMSPENNLQMTALAGAIWGTMISDIAAARGLDSVDLQRYATELAIVSPETAVEKGLIDSLCYTDQLYELIAGYNEDILDKNGQPRTVALSAYCSHMKMRSKVLGKDKVAVLYADGEIVDGVAPAEMVGGATFASKIERLRHDENVKAVVLRINSPGGSALASEVISRQLDLLREQKPLVVSIGGVAASGGYYIASSADAILAGRTSITGSIGVFSIMFNIEKGLRSKLGVTMDVVRTNPSADLNAPFRTLAPTEIAFLQQQVDDFYDTFVGRVAAGRNLSTEQVDRIGSGRIWSGLAASANGLADGFGGLKDAIALAADRAEIADSYSIYEVADAPSSFTGIFELLSGNDDARTEEFSLVRTMQEYGRAARMLQRRGVQAMMPYTIEIR